MGYETKTKFGDALKTAFSPENKTDTLANVIMPLMGVLESGLSRGKSQGTAMDVRNVILDQQDRKRKQKIEDEEQQRKALERKRATDARDAVANLSADATPEELDAVLKIHYQPEWLSGRQKKATAIFADELKKNAQTIYNIDPTKGEWANMTDEQRVEKSNMLQLLNPNMKVVFSTPRPETDWRERAAYTKDLNRVEREEKRGEYTKPSSSQYIAGNFALRMREAERSLKNLEAEGYDPTSLKAAVMNPDKFNLLKDPGQRRYANAMRTFINSNLRRESGAAIAPSEFESANKQYFAQLGDDQAVLDQKRNFRYAAWSGLKSESGVAYDETVDIYLKSIPYKDKKKVMAIQALNDPEADKQDIFQAKKILGYDFFQ